MNTCLKPFLSPYNGRQRERENGGSSIKFSGITQVPQFAKSNIIMLQVEVCWFVFGCYYMELQKICYDL